MSSQGDGDHRGVLAEGRTRAAGLAPSSVAPTAAPAGGPRPPRLLSDSRCPPGPPRPRAPTLHLQQQGQPGPASSYSPLGSLLRIPAEGRPRAEAGAGGGPSPQSPRGWRPARGLLRGQPGPVGGPRENQTIPTPGGHTGPFQAKPHVLPVTQGPRRDGAGRGQPPLASKDTGLQARRTALAGVSAPWGLGGSRGPGNTCADPLGVGGPAAFVFSLWSLAWKGRARGLSVTLSTNITSGHCGLLTTRRLPTPLAREPAGRARTPAPRPQPLLGGVSLLSPVLWVSLPSPLLEAFLAHLRFQVVSQSTSQGQAGTLYPAIGGWCSLPLTPKRVQHPFCAPEAPSPGPGVCQPLCPPSVQLPDWLPSAAAATTGPPREPCDGAQMHHRRRHPWAP